MDFVMPIATPRLLLRKPIKGSMADINGYVEAVTESIDDLKPWLSWAQEIPTISQAQEYIDECCSGWETKDNNNVGLSLWIMERQTNKFLGHIMMWNIVWESLKFEFGFWMRSSRTHQGYITEATNALTRYCFLQLGLRRIEIRCEIKNVRSQAVPKRLGFNLDRILTDNTRAVSNGELTDVVVFSRDNLNGLPELEVRWGDDAI